MRRGTHCLQRCASDDGTARVWRVSDGRLLASLPQAAPVNVARLDRSGHFAVTAGRDGWALLWNVRTRSVLRRLKYEGAVNDAEFSRSGQTPRFFVSQTPAPSGSLGDEEARSLA